MSGTTLCPHCATRFKIALTQLQAHQGMVRCGHCLQAFDARLSFVPSEPDPQLELPIAEMSADSPAAAMPSLAITAQAAAICPTATICHPQPDVPDKNDSATTPDSVAMTRLVPSETISYPNSTVTQDVKETLDFSLAQDATPTRRHTPIKTHKPATIIKFGNEDKAEERHQNNPPRKWVGWLSVLMLLILLCAQAVYFFRVEIAAHWPNLKPTLSSYSDLLGATVALPHNETLMSIESSDLEADVNQENRITLNALLRNRANYTQAFPNLELTLNNDHDQPLARRTFKPSDYLPPEEKESVGLLANHELMVKLPLDTADLKPSGYRLVLFYSAN